MMRVLVVHDHYQQPGGEDRVFADETSLLEAHGHLAGRYAVHNDDVEGMSGLALARATVWNTSSYRAVRDLVRRKGVDVVHFHNTLPLISPAAYYAARREGAAVVQTIHNYRLMCPGMLFLRDGQPCEDCMGRRLALPAIRHACYRGSHAATAAVAGMVAMHRAAGTWMHQVNAYIAVSAFVREKLLQGGLVPAERIHVKPHFVGPDPAVGSGREGGAVFVGRLSHEKGLGTLLAAWQRLPDDVQLTIIGDGPLAPLVREAAHRHANVTWLGSQPPDEVYASLERAALAIVPSECYETFGRVAIEAFAVGTPVVAADLGAVAELVDDGRTGRLFRTGDAADLAMAVRSLLDDPTALCRMRGSARREYEAKYTAERNYDMMLRIYRAALDEVRA